MFRKKYEISHGSFTLVCDSLVMKSMAVRDFTGSP